MSNPVLCHLQSFSCNPHKWMLTNFDCSTLWLTDSFSLRSVMSANPAYLQAQGNDLDFKVSDMSY